MNSILRPAFPILTGANAEFNISLEKDLNLNQRRIPLFLTLFRIFATLPIAYLIYLQTSASLWVAAFVFIVASITDYFDGYLARKYNAVTQLGKFLDPVADKVLVTGVLAILVHQHIVSPWMLILFVSRDTIIGGVRAAASAEGLVIDAKATGKWKAALQMVSLPLLIAPPYPFPSPLERVPASLSNFFPPDFAFNHALGSGLLWVSVILSLFSGWQYIQLYRNSQT